MALVVLIYMGWSTSTALSYPYDGIISLHPTGLVREINPNGPTAGILQEGDIILSIDGIPMAEAWPLYGDKRAGDWAELIVQRNGESVTVTIQLGIPTFDETINRQAPLLVALIFWVIAVGFQAYKPAIESTNAFFAFFQVGAVLLITGVISSMGPPWAATFMAFLMWMIGPLMVHFHLDFPQPTRLSGQKYWLAGLYFLAVLGGSPYLLWGSKFIHSKSWFPQYLLVGRIYLILNLVGVLGLLFFSYRHASTPGVRGKIRIVVLGGALSLLPMITLNILPDILLEQPIVPYALAFLLLGILPLTYGYAIFRHHLVEIEKHVNRGATIILVYSTLGIFYLFLYYALQLALPDLVSGPLVNTLLVLILASIFVPLHRRVQRVVDTAFYGGWYDYRSAVTAITQGLEQITDLQILAETISHRLVKGLRLEDTCVFLRDIDGNFSIIEVAPQPVVQDRSGKSMTPLPRSSLSYLLDVGGAVERSSLRKALSDVTLTPEELQLLESEQIHLWVPILGPGQVLGLLALGPKLGGDIFSGEDMDIMRIVARQVGPIIENIHLVTRLKRHAAELELRVAERTEELHAAKERVEAILASVGEGVIVTDLNGNIVRVNTSFEAQSGYREDEIVGQNVWYFYEVDDPDELMSEMTEALKQGQTWVGELTGCRKYGAIFDAQVNFTPLRDENFQIVGYVGSQRDVTKQKDLDRLKDRLIFDVSHELRTPVTNLNLYVELLENSKPEKWPNYLKVLKSETGRLIELIESILDLSRLDMLKTRKVEFSPVDLNLLADQVMAAHRALAESVGLELVFEPDEGLPAIQGELNQLSRLITNLISNAIRYTPDGRICLRTSRDGDQVCLQVCDTGIGIDEEDQPHIFERFYRGRQVRQSKITGTGLGLAIVKEIVEIHSGKIEIISNLGKGSTFNIWIPIQTG